SNLNAKALSYCDVCCLLLRDAEINAQRICLLDMKHREVRVISSDQVAYVHVAGRNDTGEGRSHAFECDLLLKITEISGVSVNISLVCGLRTSLGVGIELRLGSLPKQPLVSGI